MVLTIETLVVLLAVVAAVATVAARLTIPPASAVGRPIAGVNSNARGCPGISAWNIDRP
jgi:hypothetical protein